ncbi:(2Fe-2S)-binding protein [Roseinatronobacter alkalisoli]|uniref:(2Fe-2S)-binding protein n=1 Tax=Roseinatronobacter alkalisoli TaxID=3028235 RepID=A0ABT5TEQ5_9RHOB|nr:(2Fe-2S)-binding protein [Roseinatronobacter sp. HJB301]MDD7973590.1 (2Fe-2S)-binding protein [Roseinatronobacter sp. HJB301]
MRGKLHINGEWHSFHADPATPLHRVLREQIGLTGAKDVCGEGFCGACLVEVEGEPVAACLLPVALAECTQIVTIEGLYHDPVGRRVMAALEAEDAVQCGMCFPGMVMTLTHLLKTDPTTDREKVKHALVGNICRCTGYERIVSTACRAAKAMAEADVREETA